MSARGLFLGFALCAGALCVGTGCGGGHKRTDLPDGVTRRDTTIEHEACDIESASAERVDVNGDGRPDIMIVRNGQQELCRAVDLNLDGVIDRWTYLDANGKVRRQESDYDRDGRIDEIAYFRDGVLIEKHRATTLHNRLDTWHFYENGKLVRTERDSRGDAVIDQWWEYPSPDCPIIHSDVNNDGRPDPGASVDYCKETGYVPPVREAAKAPEGPKLDKPVETVTEVDNRPADAEAEEGRAQ